MDDEQPHKEDDAICSVPVFDSIAGVGPLTDLSIIKWREQYPTFKYGPGYVH